MAHKFAELAFTPNVKAVQTEMGSRRAYENMDTGGDTYAHEIGDDEAAFIESRTSFYIATVSETSWPYIQHRGGHAGFLKAIDKRTLGFIDYRGNRQYVSVGNLRSNDRVSMFFMDYPLKARLKLLGRARVISFEEAGDHGLSIANDYRAKGERAMLIDVEGVDWNCPQHITERLPIDDVRGAVAEMQKRIASLESENADLKRHLGQ